MCSSDLLKGSVDQTARVFRFLSRVSGCVGVATLLLLFSVAPSERLTVIGYAGITLLVAFLMTLIKGEHAPQTRD